MAKILARVLINYGDESNIDCLNIINTNKYVWIYFKPRLYKREIFWIKSNKITFNKNKTKCYVNNLSSFVFFYNIFEIDKRKRITLIKQDTEPKEIIVYDKFPNDVLKRYKKTIKNRNNELIKRININDKILDKLIYANTNLKE